MHGVINVGGGIGGGIVVLDVVVGLTSNSIIRSFEIHEVDNFNQLSFFIEQENLNVLNLISQMD